MFWFNFLVEIIFTDSWELLHNLTLLTFRGSCFSQGRRVPIVAEPERGSSAFTASDEIGAKFTAETLKIERKKRKPEVIGACRMEGHKAPESQDNKCLSRGYLGLCCWSWSSGFMAKNSPVNRGVPPDCKYFKYYYCCVSAESTCS